MNDQQLQLDLDDMTRQYFFNACDPLLQSLLAQCEWRLTSQAKALTLIIGNCSGGVIKNALHQNGGNQHKN
jgi:hypothetical protein